MLKIDLCQLESSVSHTYKDNNILVVSSDLSKIGGPVLKYITCRLFAIRRESSMLNYNRNFSSILKQHSDYSIIKLWPLLPNYKAFGMYVDVFLFITMSQTLPKLTPPVFLAILEIT